MIHFFDAGAPEGYARVFDDAAKYGTDDEQSERPSKRMKTMVSELEVAKAHITTLTSQNEVLAAQVAALQQENANLAGALFFQSNSLPAGLPKMAVDLDDKVDGFELEKILGL